MAWEYRRFVEAPSAPIRTRFPRIVRAWGLRTAKPAQLFAMGVAPLAVLWGAPIVWRLFFWCAYRISAPPETYFSPAKYRKIVPPSLFYGIFAVIFAKAYWGKNKTVGIFEASKRHPPAPIRTYFPRIVPRRAHAVLLGVVRAMRSVTHRAIKLKPPVREPTISNLLALRVAEAEF